MFQVNPEFNEILYAIFRTHNEFSGIHCNLMEFTSNFMEILKLTTNSMKFTKKKLKLFGFLRKSQQIPWNFLELSMNIVRDSPHKHLEIHWIFIDSLLLKEIYWNLIEYIGIH